MIRNISILFIMLGLMFYVLSCTDEEIADEQTIAKAYVDILILKENYESNNDSLVIKQNEVFKKYNLTSKTYENTLKSFKFDKKTWKEFFKKVYARIDTLKNRQLSKEKKIRI